MVKEFGSELLSRSREMTKGEKLVNTYLTKFVIDPLGYDENPKFKPTEFGRGVAAGLEETGLGFATLAFYISEYPEQTKELLGKDLVELMEDPRRALRENRDLITELGKDWWNASESEGFEHFSYDMGKITGILFTRLLTKGVGSMENLVYLTPASGQAQRLLLVGEMAMEEYGPTVRATLAEDGEVLVQVWDGLEQHMRNCFDPYKQEAYADCMKNLYLNSKNPQEHPVKLSTATFLRDEFAYVLFTLVQRQELDLNAIANFAGAFSALGAVMAGYTTATLAEGEIPYFNLEEAPDETQMNAMKIGYGGIKKAIDAGKMPKKESFIVLTNGILQYYFGTPAK